MRKLRVRESKKETHQWAGTARRVRSHELMMLQGMSEKLIKLTEWQERDWLKMWFPLESTCQLNSSEFRNSKHLLVQLAVCVHNMLVVKWTVLYGRICSFWWASLLDSEMYLEVATESRMGLIDAVYQKNSTAMETSGAKVSRGFQCG